jgi:hypothetical protein
MSFHHREPLHMEIMKEKQIDENMKLVPGHGKDNVLAAIVISRLFAVCLHTYLTNERINSNNTHLSLWSMPPPP